MVFRYFAPRSVDPLSKLLPDPTLAGPLLKCRSLGIKSLGAKAVISAIALPIYTWVMLDPAQALVPDRVEIFRIQGRNDLGIRRGPQYGPVQAGTFMKRGESLHLPGSGKTFAQLRFQKSGQDMGLQMQASTKNKTVTLYYFPCRVQQGDTTIIEWKNPSGGRSGCEAGIRVQRSPRAKAGQGDLAPVAAIGAEFPLQSAPIQLIQPTAPDLLAQVMRGRVEYCTAIAPNGNTWLGVAESSDACEQPLEDCQKQSGSCEIYNRDNSSIRAAELTVTVRCANQKNWSEKTTGAQLATTAIKLWEQRQGEKFCSFHSLDSEADEVIVAPLVPEETLIETRSTAQGVEVDVIKGQVNILTQRLPQGQTISAGQRLTQASGQQDRLTSFDNRKESIELQVYYAERRGVKLCDQEQVAGGQEGDSRTIQLTDNQGEVRIDYDMFSIPDRLQVLYEGKSVLDTGLVSFTGQTRVRIQGETGQMRVILTGNPENSGTQWKYTLYCPQ
ncbi:MAG: hypothetical protein VKJ24_10380 [Synechococcales bacterium]|nr:hypothetical protein [Synechococcales bacterium]